MRQLDKKKPWIDKENITFLLPVNFSLLSHLRITHYRPPLLHPEDTSNTIPSKTGHTSQYDPTPDSDSCHYRRTTTQFYSPT